MSSWMEQSNGGGLVLEEVTEPWKLGKDQAALLSYVRGEYQDSDGDFAQGFITAELPPDLDSTATCAGGAGPSGLMCGPDTCNHGPGVSKARSRPSVEAIILSDDDSADEAYQEPLFACQLCGRDVQLSKFQIMPKCSCMFCVACTQSYMELQLEGVVAALDRRSNGDAGAAAATGGGRHTCDTVVCPGEGCGAEMGIHDCRSLAPGAFELWEEACSAALLLSSRDFLSCPGCGISIEKVPSAPPPGVALCGVPEIDKTLPFTMELDNDGRPLSRSSLCHRSENRFRCAMCSTDFCGKCSCRPYHLGRTCEEQAAGLAAAHCLYCDEVVPRGAQAVEAAKSASIKQLTKDLKVQQVDISWCKEKGELVGVKGLAAMACPAGDCQAMLRQACTRPLVCGHRCGGVRGEVECLPCLEDGCREAAAALSGAARPLPAADDFCPICWVEPLRRAPAVRLACGHVVHRGCALDKVKQGYPGPHISFAYLNCPLCNDVMQHPELSWQMKRPLLQMQQVKEKSLERVRAEGRAAAAPELRPGGTFFGKLEEYALHVCRFYECSVCKDPYYGGDRRCGEGDAADADVAEASASHRAAAAEAAAPERPPSVRNRPSPKRAVSSIRNIFRRSPKGEQREGKGKAVARDAEAAAGSAAGAGGAAAAAAAAELICGDCVAKANGNGECLRGHGKGYVEFKCKFCCSVATYFCFGTTHFCTTCHSTRPDIRSGGSALPACPGKGKCPLNTEHPPNGTEFCLGCSLCRLGLKPDKSFR